MKRIKCDCNKGMMRVYQSEPYGDTTVEVCVGEEPCNECFHGMAICIWNWIVSVPYRIEEWWITRKDDEAELPY